MRIFFTTGAESKRDDGPQLLGSFKTFIDAEKTAREILVSEPSGVLYLYLLWSNCEAAALPVEFLGWRGRFRLVRVLTTRIPRRSGTPCLFAVSPENEESVAYVREANPVSRYESATALQVSFSPESQTDSLSRPGKVFTLNQRKSSEPEMVRALEI